MNWRDCEGESSNTPQLPDDQRAAIAHRVLKRRTALSNSERAQKAGEARAASAVREKNTKMIASPAADATAELDTTPTKKQRTTRARTAVAKQANVAENKVRQIAEIEKHDPAAANRIARGETTIREEKAALNKAHREAIKAKPSVLPANQQRQVVGGDRAGAGDNTIRRLSAPKPSFSRPAVLRVVRRSGPSRWRHNRPSRAETGPCRLAPPDGKAIPKAAVQSAALAVSREE